MVTNRQLPRPWAYITICIESTISDRCGCEMDGSICDMAYTIRDSRIDLGMGVWTNICQENVVSGYPKTYSRCTITEDLQLGRGNRLRRAGSAAAAAPMSLAPSQKKRQNPILFLTKSPITLS